MIKKLSISKKINDVLIRDLSLKHWKPWQSWTDKNGNTVYGNPLKYNKGLEYLMDTDPQKTISGFGIKARKTIHPLFMKLLPLVSKNKLVVLNNAEIPEDRNVIYVATHGFRDDISITLKAIKEHAYVVFASLPDFFYTPDGLALWANGCFLMDRKDKESRKSLLPKIDYAFSKGLKRVLFCTEGVWNKSPNELILNQWRGAYVSAKRNDAIIVPIASLNKDIKRLDGDEGICYAIVGDPIDSRLVTEEEAMEQMKHNLATKKYELLEFFSKDKRERIGNASEYWDRYISELISTANTCDRCLVKSKDGKISVGSSRLYDYSIENSAEYIDKKKTEESDVFSPMQQVEITPDNCKILLKTRNIPEKKREYYE